MIEGTPIPSNRRLRRHVRVILALAMLAMLGGCASHPRVREATHRPAEVRAQIQRLLPAQIDDRQGWATDIYAAFAALDIAPSTSNLCATLAVAAQESSFHTDPAVPGLGAIARAEIDRRAAQHHVPRLLVSAALAIKSPSGRSYSQRIASARTERQLSLIYEDFIGMAPLGRQLFGDANPVHTGGPMQVSVDFAEQHARDHTYPYPPDGSIRHEVFSRRGGLYFGIAHLLGYPADYDRALYRFADFNAGFYASRNAAFQRAVSAASGIALALDGDLVRYGSSDLSATERAVQTLANRLDLTPRDIHDGLEQGASADFSTSPLYRRVFALADRLERRPLPRAMVPRITLKSPKITRKLSTAWFADRVDQRYQRCMATATTPLTASGADQ